MVLKTPIRTYADFRQIELLRKRKKAGTLGKLQLTQPLWLPKNIAAELGFNTGTEDFLLEPQPVQGRAVDGRIPQPALTAESSLEIPDERLANLGDELTRLRQEWIRTGDTTIKAQMDEVSRQINIIRPPSFVPTKLKPAPSIAETPIAPLTPEISLTGDFGLLYQEYKRTGGTLDVVSWGAAGAPLRPDMETEPTNQGLQQFLDDLTQAGQIADVENILRLAGSSEEEIDRIVGVETRQRELEDLVAKTFPDLDLEGFASLVETDPDAFLERIKQGGYTSDKENLLKMMGVSSKEIDRIIPPWWTLDYWKQAFFKPYGGKDLKGKAVASFVAGTGDVIKTTGGAARWLGWEDAGNVLSTIGTTLGQVAPPDTLGEFEVGDLFNPEFYATKITRAVPFTLSLLPLAIGGYVGGGAVAAALGIGRIGSMIIGGLGGAALSRPLESAMEAGGAYDDAIARGKTEAEAKKEADEVFKNNMTLAGADAFEIAIALAPTPKWVPSSLVRAGLVRTARISGKMVIVGLSEGGEELYQDMITRHARGEEWKLDPVSKEVFAIGMVMGLGGGLGGDVLSGVVEKAKTKMSGALRSQFNRAVADFKAEGFTTEQAQLRALDIIAGTPEGEKAVSEAIKEVAPEPGVIAPEAKAPVTEEKPPVVEKPLVKEGVPEVTPAPEVTKLTGDTWNRMPPIEREQLGVKAKLDAERRGARWIELFPEEKRALIREFKKEQPATPKAEVVTPTAPAVARPEPAEVVAEELPTAINKVRQEHDQVRSDVEAIRSSLKGKTDIGSRLTRQVLVGTERELAIADRLLSGIETKEKLASEQITQLKDRIKATIALAKAKTEQVQSYKQALVDFVNTLPKEVRGKMLASIKNVRTEQGLENATNRALDLAEQYNQKTLRTEIRKEIKKARAKIKDHILKGKFTPEVQERLNVIDHNLSLDRDIAREKMAENISQYDAGQLSYEDMLKANEALNFAGIEGMSSEELANTLEYIKILETIGRSERQAKQETETNRITAIRGDISNILTGGKGLKTAVGAVSERQLAAKPGWLDTFVNWQYGIDNLADKLSKFDTASKPFQSAINKFVSAVHRATHRQVIGTKEAYEQVKKTVSDACGVKSTHDLNQALNGLDEEVNLGTFELTQEYRDHQAQLGREVKKTSFELKMTRDELIAKYMQMQDPTLNDTFTTGMGWSQQVRDAIENNLTAAEKKLTDAFFSFYEGYYQSVNEIYQELYNVNMPHNPRYSPIRRDFESEVAEQLLTFQDASQYASVLNGSLKARQRNIRPLRFNGATKILSNHIEQMEHFKAWATTMRDMRRVFGNKEIRQAIDQYHGRGISKLLDTFMNQMARGGIETAATNRVADYLRRSFTKSILAIKPVIGLKQIPSIFAYISEMNITDFFTGIADYWKSPVANAKFLYDHSELYRARVSAGFERDIRAAMEKHGKKAITGQGKLTDWFLLQIRAGDVFAVTQGMWAKYQAGLKQGLSQETAIAAAEDTTSRTQPSFGIDTLSAIQNGGSWLKLMTMFQNQPNKYFRIVGDNMRNFKYGRGSRAKAASTIFLTWVILPMMFQFIADAFQWKPERQARAGILGPLNYILIGGQLVQSAWGWLTDQPYDYQVSPVAATLRDLQMVFLKARKLVDQGLDPYKDISGSDMAAAIEYLAKAGGQVTGLPTPYLVQLSQLIRHKFEEGEKLEIKDFLFSEWSLEPPAKNAEQKVEEANLELGELKEGQEDKPLSEKELKVNTTVDWLRKIGDAWSKSLPDDVLASRTASKESKAWANFEIARSKADIFPDIPLYKINTEDNDDTIINYYQQWQARQRITSLAKLIEFDKLYPKAYLGNVSRQQYGLLVAYLNAEDKRAFLDTHEELRINPRNEWLKVNPTDNAYLALGGQAKILTKEAYTEFQRLIKELDIPDSAIPVSEIWGGKVTTMPSDELITANFERNDIVDEWGSGSPEDQLIRAKNPELNKWLGLKEIDTPIASLELKVKNRANFDKLDAFSDKDSPDYIADEKARAEAVKKFKADNPEFVDDTKRIEAIEKGTEKDPTDSKIVDANVAYGKLIDKEGVGSSSAEVMLYRVDNPDYDKWRQDETIWGDNALKPVDQSRIPIWRIDVKYAKEDAEYQTILDKYDDTQISQQNEAIRQYLGGNEVYRKDRRRREAYQKDFPSQLVEPFVQYWELPTTGYRQERLLINTPGLAEAIGRQTPKRVPSEEWDILNEKTDRTPEDDLRMDAYKLYVPDDQIEDYVDYKTLPQGTYEDDWFLMEHPDFYKEVHLGILGNQRKDYRKVPTREVFAKYQHYNTLNFRADQDKYRLDNPDLDEWGVLKGIWTETMTEKRRRMSISQAERIQAEIEERLKKLKEAVGSR